MGFLEQFQPIFTWKHPQTSPQKIHRFDQKQRKHHGISKFSSAPLGKVAKCIPCQYRHNKKHQPNQISSGEPWLRRCWYLPHRWSQRYHQNISLSLQVNPDIEDVDISLIVGANDITNSAAQEVEGCSIWGMPVIEVWKSKFNFAFWSR